MGQKRKTLEEIGRLITRRARKEAGMIRDYIRDAGISVYALARKGGIPYSTLNDLINGKVEIDNCKVGMVRCLADALGLSLDEVYSLCTAPDIMVCNSYGVESRVSVRAKTYFAHFEYRGEPVELELCRVNDDSTFYLDEIVRWRTERYIRDRRMAEFE